ncbi:MAG: helix-turn-helix domain-containing protein [Clostridia bacterium]|nr:helix-turn-helix domain-containing protein [Clostridia bacterium]
MRKTVVNQRREFSDFNIIQYGHEDCAPGYSIGNFVRSNYLIHYIHKGSGTYSVRGKEYTLRAHDAFLIYPDEITYYVASEEDPWEYSWVEFNGTGISKYFSASLFTREEPVAYSVPGAEEAILALSKTKAVNPYEITGLLYRFLGAFVTMAPKKVSMADEYVNAAISYIHTFYYEASINVDRISNYVGIDRSYLYRLFKEKMGVSPKKYIIEYKLKTAAKLLRETNLSVGQVSLSTGFEDQLYFSTAFRAYFGVAPTKYRK